MRALELMEQRVGADAVRERLKDLAGGDLSFTRYPRTEEFFTELRKMIEAAV